MKVVNVILSILILLLAIASAVFSYFLFEKRSQLVGGWEKLATAINQTAAAIDADSGSQYSNKLSAQQLSHEKYADLTARLADLKNMTAQLVKERNDLADALHRLGVASGANAGDKMALRRFETYNNSINDIVNGVTDVNTKQKNAISKMAKALNDLGVRADANALAANSNGVFDQLNQNVGKVRGRTSDYEGALRNIAGKTGAGSLQFGDNYKPSTDKAVSSVQTLKENFDKSQSAVTTANNSIRDLQNTIRERDSRIADLQKHVDVIGGQVNDLKKALKIDAKDELPMPWKTGSVDAREKIAGKVLEVNTKYGYIGIDLGTDSRVMQQVGDREIAIDPQIEDGLELKIYRGSLDTKMPEFIAAVKLTRVGNGCSIANIPAGADIQVGDKVCFEPVAKN